ncbi:hypothetical protein ACFRAM_13365 [Paenibacillus sp. NPDC056722]|uniref:hypothetical protein n=1 Tax=Paenibacillus sp. NPDC056722 TaxID=3345924 RepID=UPI0036D10C92
MKKTWGIASAVVGMLATGSAGVYAGSNLQQIKAFLNYGIAIQVNGAAYAPVDGSGKKLTPITYDGLTYLPTRAIAGALGVPVSYDAVANKVIIGSDPGSTGGSPTSSVKKSKNLPADFPVAGDAIITDLTDSVVDGKKKVVLVYLTKDSIETMGKKYTDYVDGKNITQASKVIDKSSMVITGKLGGKSPVSIIGGLSASKAGYTEITITWSEG